MQTIEKIIKKNSSSFKFIGPVGPWIVLLASHEKLSFFPRIELFSQSPLLTTRSKRHFISFSPIVFFLLMHSKCAGNDAKEDIEIDQKIKCSTTIEKNILNTFYFVILKPIFKFKICRKNKNISKMTKNKKYHFISKKTFSCILPLLKVTIRKSTYLNLLLWDKFIIQKKKLH